MIMEEKLEFQDPLLSQQGKKEQKVWSTTALFTPLRVILYPSENTSVSETLGKEPLLYLCFLFNFLHSSISWLFVLSNNLNKSKLLFSIKQVVENIFVVMKSHQVLGWVVWSSREVIITFYLALVVHIWLYLVLSPLI